MEHVAAGSLLWSEESWAREKGRGVKKKRREETLQDEGAAEEKGQLLFLSYGNGNEVGHGAWDNRGPQAGWASPCKLLPVREPFSPHFYWLTSHLQANYKEASPSKLEAAAVCGAGKLFPGQLASNGTAQASRVLPWNVSEFFFFLWLLHGCLSEAEILVGVILTVSLVPFNDAAVPL